VLIAWLSCIAVRAGAPPCGPLRRRCAKWQW
jgi:hypothetical protein